MVNKTPVELWVIFCNNPKCQRCKEARRIGKEYKKKMKGRDEF